MTMRAAMATMTTTPARAKASARRGSVVSRRRVARANANANAMRGTRRGMMSLARANHHRGDDARASERFDPLNLETGDDDDDDASRVSRLARDVGAVTLLSLIHISEPTRPY